MQKNKTLSIVTLVLLLTLTLFMTSIESIEAETVQPTAFLAVSPNPAGVNQLVVVTFWLYPLNPVVGEEFTDFTVLITKPDGTSETKGPFTAFQSGSMYFEYTPTVVGEYDFKFTYPGETLPISGWVFLPAETPITTLVVQEEPVPSLPYTPIPTDYWERPISTEHTNWASISGSWLQVAYDSTNIVYGDFFGGFNPYSQAPRSSHVMWTNELGTGGLVGGNAGNWGYYTGVSEYPHVAPPVIIGGKLYYYTHMAQAGGLQPYYEGFVCEDLRTGEEIWRNDQGSFDVGQLFQLNIANGAGVIPFLWDTTGSTWDVYDASNGDWVFAFENAESNILNAASHPVVHEEDGSMSYYIMDGANNWLAKWNSNTAFFENGLLSQYGPGNVIWWAPYPDTFDWRAGLEWNVTIPERRGIGGPYDPNEIRVPRLWAIYDDIILAAVDDTSTRVYWLIAYDRNTGQELWARDDQERGYQNIPGEGIYASFNLGTSTWTGYDIQTGNKIWETEPNEYPWGSYNGGFGYAYGKLYAESWDGYIRAYDVETGSTVWEFSSGTTTETIWNTWTFYQGPIIADGVVFGGTGTLDPSQPYYRGHKVFAVDAETGEEIWNIAGLMSLRAIADGYLVATNAYDNQLYVFGKGPSATTVTAPDVGITLGDTVMIKGTVTDQSPGAMGTPAISDEDMTAWMEYMYMQKSKPADAMGVEVSLDVIDSNGNFRNIGTTTTDSSGTFGFMWEPDIPGQYTVMATFAGSESYGSSYAQTYLGVVEAPAATPPPDPTPAPMTDTYVLGMGATAIVAIIVIGLVLILMMRKR